MTQFFVAIASILAGLAVAAGAFASHGLKGSLSDVASATRSVSCRAAKRSLEIFETGTRYQMYHALALLLVALLLSQEKISPKFLGASGYAFIIGIAIFSGSLYALSFTGIKWFGAITPIGGAAFLVGWGCLAISAFNFQ